MKKLLLIAALGVVGFASAKGKVEKVNSKAKEVTTIITKNNKKVKKIAKKQVECGVFQASCISAYTCQDWTPSQWYNWMEQIQENYCQLW
ncbi:hypothetical protein ACP3T3_15205 [Chryseobacterium sp. CBSDS_008]|uniref:hypothetical protein n=1 Tax=Chryseobacterium sp. CBSDS_008 TaxID=3415265 RepID=UPI003CE929CE